MKHLPTIYSNSKPEIFDNTEDYEKNVQKKYNK
jgi:hypothetical protein